VQRVTVIAHSSRRYGPALVIAARGLQELWPGVGICQFLHYFGPLLDALKVKYFGRGLETWRSDCLDTPTFPLFEIMPSFLSSACRIRTTTAQDEFHYLGQGHTTNNKVLAAASRDFPRSILHNSPAPEVSHKGGTGAKPTRGSALPPLAQQQQAAKFQTHTKEEFGTSHKHCPNT